MPHAARTLESFLPEGEGWAGGEMRRRGIEGGQGELGAQEICVTNCSYSALQVGCPVCKVESLTFNIDIILHFLIFFIGAISTLHGQLIPKHCMIRTARLTGP
jgi:hypothetical protein